jgi:hypothetical protein
MFYFCQSIVDYLEDVGAANIIAAIGLLGLMYWGFC